MSASMSLQVLAAKQRLAGLARSLGYAVYRQRGPTVALFNALCDLKASAIEPDPDLARFVAYCRTHFDLSQSQRFQDLLADFIMDGKPGVFCEFGATNGLDLSNTAMLEKHRSWTGLLAEPGRRWHQALAANRPNAKIDTRCVYARTGETVQFAETAEGEYSGIESLHGRDTHGHRRRDRTTYSVETVSLNDVLEEHGIERLDYLSVDTEGSELVILREFDFKRFRPRLVTVEHGFSEVRNQYLELFTEQSYRRIFADLSGFDDWYVSSEVR